MRLRTAHELAALADGTLAPERRPALLRRISRSPKLARQLKQQLLAIQAVRQLDARAPANLRKRIRSAGESGHPDPGMIRRMSDASRVAGPLVREVREADAESLLRLQHALDRESSMMMLEQGERTATADEVRAHVQNTVRSSRSTILAAVAGKEVVGYVEAQGGTYRRTRHSAYVVIGVLRSWQGRGLGHTLLGALEEWAHAHGIRRLELTVRVDNDRARRLYERAGYVPEGIRRGSLLVEGEPVDEIAMARIL